MEHILPNYDQIPDVGLYLEQVTKYLNAYLEPLGCAPLTGSMISNYVKKDLVKNPVKKQYGREHIARLLMIAVAKTVLSLEEIQQLLKSQPEGEAPYAAFCAAFLGALKTARDDRGETLWQDTLSAVSRRLVLEQRFREEGVC